MPYSRLLALAVALLLLIGDARTAHADPPSSRASPVYVLTLDTEEVEDQAEALTAAIRSRVRNASGWSLSETTVTLSMLTAALKCPRNPDANCLVKIGDQLKTDRFIWGTMQKGGGGMVKADVHLWMRGKAGENASEIYSDNLKDQNDERLGRVAQRIWEKVSGGGGSGVLSIRAGDGNGVVLVDGQRRAFLEKGAASVELPAGSHDVEVRVQGYPPSRQSVVVVSGKEAHVAVKIGDKGEGPSDQGAASTSTARTIGWSLVGVGGTALAVGLVEGVIFVKKALDQSDLSQGFLKQPAGHDACNPDTPSAAAAQACDNSNSAKTVSTIGWIFGGVGAVTLGAGLYVLSKNPAGSDDKSEKKDEKRASIRLVPTVSPQTQGLLVTGTF